MVVRLTSHGFENLFASKNPNQLKLKIIKLLAKEDIPISKLPDKFKWDKVIKEFSNQLGKEIKMNY